MQLVYVILKQTDKVDDLMVALANNGIKGATILESTGMAKSLYKLENIQTMDLLRQILQKEDANASRTVLILVNDDMVETVRSTVKEIMGDLSLPNAGIIFAVPVTFAEGI